MFDAIDILLYVAIVLMSVVIHEVSHGLAAYAQGDKTAYYMGRLTLNPLPHLDPIGSIILPLTLALMNAPAIGWAKPVPYNPYNLREQKWGPALVGLAGPASNIAIALFFGLLLRFSDHLPFLPAPFWQVAAIITYVNIALSVLNLMPIPPLDGSKLLIALLPYQSYRIQAFFDAAGLLLIIPLLFVAGPIIGSLANLLFNLLVGLP